MIELELPYPPTVNHYWQRNGRQTFVSSEGKRFRSLVKCIWLASGAPRVEGKVLMSVMVLHPDKRRRDLDNLLKAICDALEHSGAYEDDVQLWGINIVRMGYETGGRISVKLEGTK